jgi:hypothetical protein
METDKMPTTDECIKKMWPLYTMEFYPVIKKNEILSFVGELQNIILIEVSQVQKAKSCMFSLVCGIQT